MVNYYTQTVITEPVLLSPDLVAVLEARGAELDCLKEETILDGIVHERPPVALYTVVFHDGWRDACDDVDEFLVDYAGWDEEDVLAASEELRRLVVADEPEILRAILRLNPKASCIDMQSGWGCSRLRLDGPGGSGLIVTKLGYLYITSSDWNIEEDGSVANGSTFTRWMK